MPQLELFYQTEELQQISTDIIKKALSLGASGVIVELMESINSDLQILNGQIESFENSHENQLALSVFIGNKKGSLAISTLNPQNIDQTIKQALDIASYTEEDLFNGIIETEYLATSIGNDLYLYNPISLNNNQLISSTKKLEELALNIDDKITASDGASVSLNQINFLLANSNGLTLGYRTSRYGSGVTLIGKNSSGGMQTDYWYSQARDYNELLSQDKLAKTAVNRVLRKLTVGKFNTSRPKVILENGIAGSFIRMLMSGLTGNNLYRKLSFLNNSLNQAILPEWLSIREDPFIVKGLSSCYFDNEGAQVFARNIIEQGVVKNYLLSSYSARKLNLTPTGNSGGNHNLSVTSNFTGDLPALANYMNDGIIIIDTIGQGLNLVTGDFSFAASGLAVINGNIEHYVENLTISGNLKELYKNILHIAQDINHQSSLHCGSMLIAENIIQVTVG